MLTDHQHFEELCALIAAGQAPEDHLLEWQDHAQECAECRSLRRDFAQTARAIVVSDNSRAPRHEVPAGMTERFVAHARSAGVPLSRNEAEKRPQVRSFFSGHAFNAAAAAALIALIAFLSWMFSLNRAGFTLLKPFHASNSPLQTPAIDSVGQSLLLQENSQLQQRLRDTQAERRVLVAQLNDMRQALESAERRSVEINARLDELQRDSAAVEKGRVNEIAQLREQLERVNSQKDSARLAADVQYRELQTVHDKVEQLSTQLAEAQQLGAAANQAKDLIVARNLHIVDVHDNEIGSKPRPFGRIFYAEGKKLVFFAYDLGDPQKLSAKVSFYVWGEKAGTTKEVKNLGIFRADDRQDGRWVLTFDDARVLAQINTIFVTSESKNKRITKPNGNRILTAFLDDAPNHP